MKVRPVGVEMFHAKGQKTDGQIWQSWWSLFTILPAPLRNETA